MSELVSKECRNCKKTKRISEFPKSKFTKDGYECFCRTCKKEKIISKDSLIEYLDINNTEFNEINFNDAFNWSRDRELKKYPNHQNLPSNFNELVMKSAISKYYAQGNISGNYEHFPLKSKNNKTKKKDSKKDYNEKWRGNYTESEINYLNEYVQNLIQDYNIITRNHMDYAMKIAKASLAMDIAYEEMLDNSAGAEKRYESCKKIFDDLCKSAQFNESSRSANDVVGLGSVGVITKRLEDKGFIPTNLDLDIPDDNTEKVLNDYKYIITSSTVVI